MNKKHQSKLEDIENEVDSFKKKRGRPVGSKNKDIVTKEAERTIKAIVTTYSEPKKSRGLGKDWDAEWDNIEVPTLLKLPKSKVPLTAKITLGVMVFIIGVLLLA